LNISTELTVWIAALMTLGVYSFAFGDNPVYRIISNLFVGVAGGHSIVVGFLHLRNAAWFPLVRDAQLLQLIPIIGGVLLLTRLLPDKRVSVLGRVSLGFMGAVSGVVSMQGALETNLLRQVVATMNLRLDNLNNIIILVATVCTLVYFLFLHQGKYSKVINPISEVGKYAMMVSFGYIFGAGIAGTMTLLVGRMQFLVGQWLGIGL